MAGSGAQLPGQQISILFAVGVLYASTPADLRTHCEELRYSGNHATFWPRQARLRRHWTTCRPDRQDQMRASLERPTASAAWAPNSRNWPEMAASRESHSGLIGWPSIAAWKRTIIIVM